jgi:type IV secretion system protein VirB10
MQKLCLSVCLAGGIAAGVLSAQAPEDISRPPAAEPQQEQSAPASGHTGFKRQETSPAGSYTVDAGTRILLNMINSVSTKTAAVGDRIYLETAFPVLSNGKVVIPQGSWVQGTVTQVKRPGRIKGRGELYVRFDSLTLPNGVTRDFRGRIGAMDGRSTEDVDREEGKIKAQGNKKGDATTIAQTAGAGAGVGTIAGAATGHYGMGAGIGGAAGAAAGLVGVLLSRGPDATLTQGTTMEMVLDRTLSFQDSEVDFSHAPPRSALSNGGPEQSQPASRPVWRPWPL